MKRSLKRIAPLYRLNARLRAWQTLSRYRRLCRRYQAIARQTAFTYREEDVPHRVKQRLAPRGLTVQPVPRGMLRILYVGADRDQDTSGFLQSLERFGHVSRFTQADGRYGHYFDHRLRNGGRLITLVRDALRDGPLHLVLGQMWGRTMPWQALDTVRRMGVITVNISMDDRHAYLGRRVDAEWTGTKGLIPGLDLALTTAPEACLWYALEGCPALFWPEASDPGIFHPMDVPKTHDVCFVGGNYGIRSKIVRAIEKRGIKVECYGNGWPNGRIPTKDIPHLFACSRIILGVGTIGHCTNFYSLKMRDFDATMSGTTYLTHANPDLCRLFDVEKEMVCFRTPEEAAAKCEYYLSHDDKRKAIAHAGLARSLQAHTWTHRFERMLRALGLLNVRQIADQMSNPEPPSAEACAKCVESWP